MLFQDATYLHERMGGFIWAPEKTFADLGKYNWEVAQRVQKGDVLYSFCDKKIVSICIAQSDSKREKKPLTLDIPAAGYGWYVDINYNHLKRAVSLLYMHISEITKLCTKEKSPFTIDGDPKEGYIYEIPYEAHKYIMKIVSPYNISSGLDIPVLSDKDITLVNQINHLVSKCDTIEEKKLAVKMGILDTVLKQRLLCSTKKCAVCDIDYDMLLSAYYCKPWESASSLEKINTNNALLLCPLHGQMFENGLITFNKDGLIKISSEMKYENFKSLCINLFTSINMTPRQKEYLKWHREKIFKA